ncbi:unnamed protein product [Linum trigynum]|uniref:Uncharacterized protein n=1 Tax=Linum trigynum TaxID=586398 RepID=A0AAV2GHQ5_9ROSI
MATWRWKANQNWKRKCCDDHSSVATDRLFAHNFTRVTRLQHQRDSSTYHLTMVDWRGDGCKRSHSLDGGMDFACDCGRIDGDACFAKFWRFRRRM